MSVSGVGSQAVLAARLRAAGCVFAEDEAALLVDAAAGDPGRLAGLAERRIAGEPLETVLGWAEFCGLRIGVRPGVFVPRRRTEFLAELAVAALPARGVAVDLCCGSGAIAVVLAARTPGARVFAVDVDPLAVACAAENLAGVGTARCGDLFDALPTALSGRIDVLAVNAPYVPTEEIALMPPEARDHEPTVALDGGPDGLDVHRRVAAAAAGWLAPGGVVLIETSRQQAPGTAVLMEQAGLRATVVRDDEVDGTVVTGS